MAKDPKLIDIAQETLRISDAGLYTGPSGDEVEFSESVRAAVDSTCLYTPSALSALVQAQPTGSETTKIEVTPESTLEAGLRLQREGAPSIVLLNFASARRIGGGFLGGSRAQEEELCRCSSLFRCLETQPDYYTANRSQKSAIYTDHLIYSPDVPFFRDENRALMDEAALFSVLTAPAPNTGAVLKKDPAAGPEVASAFRRRAAMCLAACEDQGHKTLVLGAWGCGAFQGDPAVAVDAFARALEWRFEKSFSRVVFAILVKQGRDSRNLDIFQRRFA